MTTPLSDDYIEGWIAGAVAVLRKNRVAEDFQSTEPPGGSTMPYINGKNFRCECGANVFQKGTDSRGRDLFRCNGCRSIYEGS